jgi:hypothetical protein
MHYYGAVSTPKIIRTVYANINYDNSLGPAGYYTTLNVMNANGKFKVEDTVYQGKTYSTANATGIVTNYSPSTGQLTLGAVQGTFYVNNTIRAISTNGVCQIQSFYVPPSKMAQVTITPNPPTANVGDDYGYTTTITEWNYPGS